MIRGIITLYPEITHATSVEDILALRATPKQKPFVNKDSLEKMTILTSWVFFHVSSFLLDCWCELIFNNK